MYISLFPHIYIYIQECDKHTALSGKSGNAAALVRAVTHRNFGSATIMQHKRWRFSIKDFREIIKDRDVKF